MIDNYAKVARLLERMDAALPVSAYIPGDLAELLRNDAEVVRVPATCQVTQTSYAGDEGGIMCRLDLGPDVDRSFFVSITHLKFDARTPLARDIATYQKHRNKRMRRLSPPAFVLVQT